MSVSTAHDVDIKKSVIGTLFNLDTYQLLVYYLERY